MNRLEKVALKELILFQLTYSKSETNFLKIGEKMCVTKKWKFFIVNPNAQTGKNSTLYKTHKPNIIVKLLTTECNMTIEDLEC